MPLLSTIGAASAKATGLLSAAANIEVSFLADSTGRNAITVPASAQEGDFAVLYFSGALGTLATVPGWTTIASEDATFETVSCYKLLGSSDPGSTVTNPNPTSYDVMLILVFRPSSPIANVLISSSSGITTVSTVPSSQTVSTGTYGPPNLIMGFHNTYASTPTFSAPTWDGTFLSIGENNNNVLGGYLIQQENVNVTVSTTQDGGSYNRLSSFCVNFE